MRALLLQRVDKPGMIERRHIQASEALSCLPDQEKLEQKSQFSSALCSTVNITT
jgi:hypothetical protein